MRFQRDEQVYQDLKSYRSTRWSASNKWLYIPYSKEEFIGFVQYLKDLGYSVNIKAFTKKKTPAEKQAGRPKEVKLNQSQLRILEQYSKFLRGLRLSDSTIATYGNFIKLFLDYLGDKSLSEVVNSDVREFTEHIVEAKKYGISTHRQMVSALKHFRVRFDETQIDELVLVSPRKSRRLPSVLSQEEAIDLLRVTTNLKHRTILALLYSAGMRIGEVVKLRLRDLDMDRREIVIRQAKGRKDRTVVMAESIVPLIMNYVSSYQPKDLFFEGWDGSHYSPTSIRAFLKRSCRLAGITKKVTPHTLRHSYATHLIENGVNLRHVQTLLGHSKPETTMIYTHVAKKDLLNIRSPLDDAVLKVLQNDKKSLNMPFSDNLKG